MLKSALRFRKFALTSTNVFADKSSSTVYSNLNTRCIHITPVYEKKIRVNVKEKITTRAKDQIVLEGEQSVDIESPAEYNTLFPDENTSKRIFNGIPYNELPIINIKSTPNNTIMTITDHKGLVINTHSSGIEGFKHAKKGTNVAAQQAAITLGTRIIERGIKTIRLRIQGIGPGRMSSVKGLQLAGVDVVSVTDNTRVSWNPPRPRKPRRV